MNQIFIHRENQQLGPFSPEQVRALLENQHVTPGDLAWHEGMGDWEPLGVLMDRIEPAAPADLPREPAGAPGGPDAASGEALFHHVSPVKFVIMTLVTLGLYEIWWFWRGWKDIERREGLNIWPFWRGFFAPIWFYPFATRVFEMRGHSRAGLAARQFRRGGRERQTTITPILRLREECEARYRLSGATGHGRVGKADRGKLLNG